ncbi:2-oxo acid dehydrogenase subunit E2 [Aeromicrobium sp. YIM 150415]|uniref:dihydrolipoamide acetyltransferase family protein n=1 Tax=Aeromicrobium sp. YIM 150415 TaxID=2803912 RepID=UPI0019639590|nr:dihydrolipoamide acetyltransferase family protein [Aeromicrobium sp. YIM 150415]MBM9463456.1 2-oxo acid dehydrogenase subunit E2 [Aeromicrobium sp. YIM 150415]
MPSIIHMPAVAAGAAEVVLAEWSVEEGAALVSAEPYAVIETDKAIVDLESETDGLLVRQLVAPGTSVEIGAPIALIAAPGEQVDDAEAALTDLGVGAERPSPAADEVKDVEAPAPATPPTTRVFSSPLARRMAREAGLRVEDLRGTGPGGRIVRRDVEEAVAAAATADHSRAPSVSPAPAVEAPVRPSAADRVRRATAERLTASKQQIPHFYVRGSARVDRLLSLREELRDDETPVSVNDLIVRAVAQAHRAVPELNVVWDDGQIHSQERVDIAIAVATDRGLLTPVVRDVAGRSLREVVASTRDLLDRAKSGRLAQHELEGGSVSVSNLGMFGVEDFAAIINPPQSSILAVGAVTEQVIVVDGAPVVGRVLRFTLSVDHRPVDGVVAARWMRCFTDLLEHPLRILA